MMKRHYIWIAAVALVALVGCSREPLAEEPGTEVLNAEIVDEAPTRTSYDGTTGDFAWIAGDKIALYLVKDGQSPRTQEAKVTPKNDASKGSFVYSKETGWSRTGYAVYPAAAAKSLTANNALTLTLADTYDASGSIQLPMVAVNSGETLSFYSVCGLLRIQCDNIASGVTSLTVTVAGGNSITGDHTVSYTAETLPKPFINATSGSANVVTFAVSGSAATLNLPLPCGDYTGVTVSDGTNSKTVTVPFTAKRGVGKKLKITF